MMYRILHWFFGCYGHTERKLDARGVEWVGMRCTVCGGFTEYSPSIIQSSTGWAVLDAMGHPDAAWMADGTYQHTNDKDEGNGPSTSR